MIPKINIEKEQEILLAHVIRVLKDDNRVPFIVSDAINTQSKWFALKDAVLEKGSKYYFIANCVTNPICKLITKLDMKSRGIAPKVTSYCSFWVCNGVFNAYIPNCLPIEHLKKLLLKDEPFKCNICLEEASVGVNRKGITCSHCCAWFCKVCYDRWFWATRAINIVPTCPCCRAAIPDPSGSYTCGYAVKPNLDHKSSK
jgi:hypothetical protein